MDNTIYTTHPPSNMYRYHPPAVPPHGGQRYPEQDRPSFNPGYSYRNAAFQGDEPIQPHNQFQRGGSLGPSENTPGDVGNIYQDNVYDNAGGQINSRADQYWNEADRGKQRQDPTADYDDGESVATLDPTEENHLPQAGELRNRFAKRSAGDLWQSVKESRRILAYQGLPSRGTIGRRQNLSQRIKESREAEHDQPLTLTDYTEMIRRERVMSHQNKSGGTGLYTLKRKSFYKLRLQAKEVAGRLEFWAKSLKIIEGHFGSAILSYFTFVRWLMFLNLFIGLLLFLVVTLPFLVLQPNQTFPQYAQAIAVTDDVLLNQSVLCSKSYLSDLNSMVAKHNATDYVLDFLQGTGFMENTVLFYGNYFNKTLAGFYPTGLVEDPWSMVYNMSLAYLLATGIYFIVSFILIIRHSAAGLKEGVLSQETSSTKYCNKILTGWDFCITDASKAMLKHRNLRKELEADLFEQQMERERAARRKRDWIKLYVIRFFINFFVVSVLAASLALIYLTNDWSLMLQKNDAITEQILKLLVQFLPSITITILNIIVPVFFSILVVPEGYSPGFEIKITLARTVLLRLASVFILMISLYDQVVATTGLGDRIRQGTTAALGGDNSSHFEPQVELNITSSTSECGNKNFNQVKCWETYVGQQLYKLVLLDLIVVLLVTFLVEFPRKLLHRKFHSKFRLINWLGKQQFDIPQNVLDIVYCQTLCWLGAFFSPLIPFISMLKCFIFFYVKKLTLLQNCDPPEKPFHTSRSNSFFMTVLLISFVMASIPIGYIVGRIPPSQSCGPFRVYSEPEYYMFHSLTNLIKTFSGTTRDFFYFFGSVAFYVPAIILLCLLMYYFWAVGQGYKKMGELLKTQLAMEGKDKQYLLMRVTEAFKRG